MYSYKIEKIGFRFFLFRIAYLIIILSLCLRDFMRIVRPNLNFLRSFSYQKLI